MRSTPVRVAFLLLAVVLGVIALIAYWDGFVAALGSLSWTVVLLAFALSTGYVFCMLLSWRTLLSGLGHRLDLADAVSLFGLGQIGKYIPGGVWNYLAAAELGADRNIPRATSVTAMGLSTLLNVLTALTLGCLTFIYAPAELIRSYGFLAWLIIPGLICLLPPVLNRLIAFAFRFAKLGTPPQPLAAGRLVLAVALSAGGWIFAGLALWLLGLDLGLAVSTDSFLMAVGVTSLSWAVGLLVLPAPSGAGIREAVAALTLAGSLPGGAIAVVVLMTRVLLIIADLGYALAGLLLSRRRKRNWRQPRLPTARSWGFVH